MPVLHYIVATAGHVDHGKSSLVKALTGIDPDRLPEEKTRGITIDLGFAHLELPAPSTPNLPTSTTLSLGLVDVPGHEDFVKNMVAGVGSIDLALFVVAADDGWMPQTEEHLQILTYLGVRHAVVALTKIDLAQGREEAVLDAVRRQLGNSPFVEAAIVPTSVTDGRGIAELKAALAAALANVPPPCDVGKPRLSIDRVFTLHGVGTVVTGTLNGGVLRRNQSVTVQPFGKSTRIRTVQSHNHGVEQAVPGTRTALNLPDLAVASGTSDAVARGQVVTIAELGGGTISVDVLLERSARLNDKKGGAARPMKDGALVRIHHGSANAAARLRLAGGGPLLAGQQMLAQLRLEQPLFLLGGDRFIVRDWPEQATLAGGVVLDPDAQRRRFLDVAQQQLLRERARGGEDVGVWFSTELARDRAMRKNGLLVRTRFSADAIASAAATFIGTGTATSLGEWLLHALWWDEVRKRAAAAVQAEHHAHPERSGLALTELRAAVEKDLPGKELFDLLVMEMCRIEYTQAGNVIRHRGHRLALPASLQAAGNRIRAALVTKPLEPPARKELTPDAPSHQALRFLLESGEATDLGPELVLASDAFTQASAAIQKFLREQGPATASDLRQLLNTSRRVIIPLLEKLDRDGVTQRQGDVRVLRTR